MACHRHALAYAMVCHRMAVACLGICHGMPWRSHGKTWHMPSHVRWRAKAFATASHSTNHNMRRHMPWYAIVNNTGWHGICYGTRLLQSKDLSKSQSSRHGSVQGVMSKVAIYNVSGARSQNAKWCMDCQIQLSIVCATCMCLRQPMAHLHATPRRTSKIPRPGASSMLYKEQRLPRTLYKILRARMVSSVYY